MKKTLVLSLIVLSLTSLSACGSNTDNKCQYHIDLDGDGLCENCHQAVTPTPTPEPPTPTPEPGEVVRIEATGKMTKQSYSLTDEWDTAGYTVYAVDKNNKKTKLSESEYTISVNPSKPSQYIINALVTFTYVKNISFKAAINETNIAVESPTFDEEAEKTAYYADANLTLSGESLRSELNRHSFAKHTNWVTYDKVKSYKVKSNQYESTDLIPNKSKMELFYTGKSLSYANGTREHVWPAANSSNLWTHTQLDNESTYVGGGSDLYHVRPVDSIINERRGNSLFVDFDDMSYNYDEALTDGGPYSLYGYGSNYYNQFTYVEVDDHMKGDVARIIAYLYMHYKTASGTPSSQSSKTASLYLTNVMGYSNESTCKSKLIKWSNLDPVSEVEKYRNHTVQKIQGNRNPFVDYPNLMQKVLG